MVIIIIVGGGGGEWAEGEGAVDYNDYDNAVVDGGGSYSFQFCWILQKFGVDSALELTF